MLNLTTFNHHFISIGLPEPSSTIIHHHGAILLEHSRAASYAWFHSPGRLVLAAIPPWKESSILRVELHFALFVHIF